MKVRMYRNYDKFPYESDHHGNFNGRMIFTFFRPIGREFDCILVELTEGYKPLPIERYERYSGWQMELDQVVKKENKYIKYIYDNAGIIFEHSFSVKNHLKKCRVYLDDEQL